MQATKAENELVDTLIGKEKKPKKDNFRGKIKVERSSEIRRIIIPEGMEFDSAITWLERQKEEEEASVNIDNRIKCYPLDGAYALLRATNEIFGYSSVLGEKGPSGRSNHKIITINLSDTETVQIPWGDVSFPGFGEDDHLSMSFDPSTFEFVVNGTVRKKYLPLIEIVMDKTREIIKHASIYKGRTIRVDLGFMKERRNRNSIPKEPEILNVSDMTDDKIIMSKTAELELSGVLMRIEKKEQCIRQSIPLKYGCLMAGPYGTGKTLTARWIANKANANGYTFIYLEDCRQLDSALRLAEIYSPAVVFSEDIDKAVEGDERTISINEILNTFDGIDTKTSPIITILTTNHLENINRGFLRAGRIDKLIQMGPLDTDTGFEFINKFAVNTDGESILDLENYALEDFVPAGAALTGIVPAFASEVINSAKLAGLYRHKEGKVTPSDIITASESFKNHIKLTQPKEPMSEHEVYLRMKKIIGRIESGGLSQEQIGEALNAVMEQTNFKELIQVIEDYH